jgi:hypothetical protein
VIVEDLEPLGVIACEHNAAVRMAEYRVTNRAAASIRVNEKQTSQVLTPGLGTSRAITNADIHTHRSHTNERSRASNGRSRFIGV